MSAEIPQPFELSPAQERPPSQLFLRFPVILRWRLRDAWLFCVKTPIPLPLFEPVVAVSKACGYPLHPNKYVGPTLANLWIYIEPHPSSLAFAWSTPQLPENLSWYVQLFLRIPSSWQAARSRASVLHSLTCSEILGRYSFFSCFNTNHDYLVVQP